VRDRAAERRLAPRTLRIDVNPLVIAGRVGETVDATLIDLDPAARERLGADERTQRLRRRDQRQRDRRSCARSCGSRNPNHLAEHDDHRVAGAVDADPFGRHDAAIRLARRHALVESSDTS
jgi:hypothetical protein